MFRKSRWRGFKSTLRSMGTMLEGPLNTAVRFWRAHFRPVAGLPVSKFHGSNEAAELLF